MPNNISSPLQLPRKISRTKIIIGAVVLVVVGIGGYSLWPKTPVYQFVTVERGSIAETVSVTGNTTPVSSVSLDFGNSGNIARVNFSVGKNVSKGQVLAELNTSDLYAQVRQARANVDNSQANVAVQKANVAVQRAKLQGLQAGTRPEDIAASKASLEKAEQDLVNMYNSISDTYTDSYAKANDAVRVQLYRLFLNSETSNPKLSYISANSQAQYDAEFQRLFVTEALNKWQSEITVNNQTNTSLDALLRDGVTYLTSIRQLLNSISKTLDLEPGLAADTLVSYKANVTIAINGVNTASKNLNTAAQNIASQKLTVSQLQAQLDLKRAGSTPQDIAAQQAQVASAEAAVQGAQASVQSSEESAQSARAKLQNSQIVAPISGVITQFDAKVGQYASPGTTLISIISQGAFEVDALVSETDVGKVALSNKVTMTLDAFPSETFTGSVFYIDPAQTTSEGVVGYKIKIAFDKADPRIKSGLTANIDIKTRYKDNVPRLPKYAILQNDDGTFVQVVENNVVKDIPVTLGLQDRDGNVEVISGVSEGQQVLNVGLKQK